MSTPLKVSPLAARRFMRRALLLDTPVPDVGAALAHHGYVQIDPINVCGRTADLMLRISVTDAAVARSGLSIDHIYQSG